MDVGWGEVRVQIMYAHDSGGSKDFQYSSSLVRISLYRLLHSSWLMSNAPLHVPRVHQTSLRDRCSLVFCALPLPCIMLNENRRTKKWYGEIILKLHWFLCVVYFSRSVLLLFATLNFRSVSSQFKFTVGIINTFTSADSSYYAANMNEKTENGQYGVIRVERINIFS